MVNAKNLNKHHIFHNIQVYTSCMIFKFQAIINTGTIYNLIAQDLVKEHDIPADDKVSFLMAANRGRLHFYK